jgi:predicted lipoprotein with Yx(FWY)xxD motif
MLISRRLRPSVLAACALAVSASASLAQPVTGGSVLTTRQGRTLYVFDNDVPDSGRSVCTGPCSGLHPPYLVEDGSTVAEPFGVVRREDGTRQWSYKGRPLYLFYADEKPGDANGDGLNRGTWHVAKP